MVTGESIALGVLLAEVRPSRTPCQWLAMVLIPIDINHINLLCTVKHTYLIPIRMCLSLPPIVHDHGPLEVGQLVTA